MSHLPFIKLSNDDLAITISDVRKIPIGKTGVIVYFERPNKQGIDYDTMECYVSENMNVSDMVNVIGFSEDEIEKYHNSIVALSSDVLEAAHEYIKKTIF